MSTLFPGPALTAVVLQGNDDRWLPVNYVAHCLCNIAGTKDLPYYVRAQAKRMGIVFHVQKQRGNKP